MFNVLDRPVQFDGALDVNVQRIAAGPGEVVEVLVGVLDHQVDFQRQAGDRAQRLDDERPHADVGDELAVHDVHVDAVGAGAFGLLDLLAQAGEVGGEDGRGDLHSVGHGGVSWGCCG